MNKYTTEKKVSDESVQADIYSRKPLYYHGSIPVFSEHNEYIENYDKIAADHLIAISNTCSNPWIDEESWKTMEKSTFDLLVKYARTRDKVLDVGVGLGRLSEMLSDYERYGMDIALSYLEIAKKKGIEVCMSLVEDMPYKKNYFDIVVCTDVLEHVLDFNLSIKKILTILKPKGVLVIRVPYKECLDPYLLKDYPYFYVHLRTFDEPSLTLQFTRCFRCEVLDVNKALYIPKDGRFKYRLPSRLGGKTQRAFLKVTKKMLPYKYPSISRTLIEPVFINMAVRKVEE
jgi:2-polyprenyl-3-methyl-5-hydroxy-6-metoxy-1,4-benzoquinol methylase